MAKAIMGHFAGSDPQLLAEVARLRRQVRDLEAEVSRLSSESDAVLTTAVLADSLAEALTERRVDDVITLDAARQDRSAALA